MKQKRKPRIHPKFSRLGIKVHRRPRYGTSRRRPAAVPPFLGPADFDGVDTARPKRPPSRGRGLSTYLGQVFFTNLSRTTVAGLLQPGLHLAPGLSAFDDVHPVIQLQGLQINTSWMIDGLPSQVGPQYTELILLVPFVRKGSSPQFHNFVVRMYLDDQGAINVGNLYYGYAKEPASFQDMRPASFIASVGGNTVFTSGFTQNGAWRPSAQAELDITNYKTIQAILAMPVVGLYWTGLSYACSYFDFDYTNATVAPISVQHAYHSAFTPGMPGGMLSSVPEGGVDIAGVRWRVEFPPIIPY